MFSRFYFRQYEKNGIPLLRTRPCDEHLHPAKVADNYAEVLHYYIQCLYELRSFRVTSNKIKIIFLHLLHFCSSFQRPTLGLLNSGLSRPLLDTHKWRCFVVYNLARGFYRQHTEKLHRVQRPGVRQVLTINNEGTGIYISEKQLSFPYKRDRISYHLNFVLTYFTIL